MKRKSTKQKWLNPEMTRVKLNPEQAVLSCCDVVARALTSTITFTRVSQFQCSDRNLCPATDFASDVSS
ncbi:MAG: hypothetical protein PHZ27_03260 [Candidatus Omnitrophica bacterium]|nr:hypothetical protein [Candidatus Omnitrophota bacterium]